MAVTANVEGNLEVEALLNSLPSDMFANTKKTLSKSLFNIQKTVTGRLKSGPMYSRTGALARSIKFRTSGTRIEDLFGVVFTDSVYAPIHETGGEIVAKRAYAGLQGGPFLNIPAIGNKTAAGVMRENARSVFSTGGYIVKINAAKAKYMIVKNGVPMFWLVKQVTIPARLEMLKSANDEVPTFLSNMNTVLLDGVQ